MTRLLIVDDEEAITSMLRLIFQMERWSVEVANSVTEARQILARRPFDLVITDMRIDDPQSGVAVARSAKEAKPPAAVIILSAFPMSREQWTACGADAFVLKGYAGMKELIHTAKRVVGNLAA
jgi:DNA-binding NtrC family response regulator